MTADSRTGLPDPNELEPATCSILASHDDARAREDLFALLRRRLLRIVAIRTGRHAGALAPETEDVVQDSLLEAWRDFDRVRPETSGALLRWITTIAMNNVRDAARWRRVRKDLVRLRTELASRVGDPAQRAPPELVAAGELERATDRAMLELDPADRELLLLRNYEGASAREIAAALGITTEEAVRARLLRARRRLQSRLGGLLG